MKYYKSKKFKDEQNIEIFTVYNGIVIANKILKNKERYLFTVDYDSEVGFNIDFFVEITRQEFNKEYLFTLFTCNTDDERWKDFLLTKSWKYL